MKLTRPQYIKTFVSTKILIFSSTSFANCKETQYVEWLQNSLKKKDAKESRKKAVKEWWWWCCTCAVCWKSMAPLAAVDWSCDVLRTGGAGGTLGGVGGVGVGAATAVRSPCRFFPSDAWKLHRKSNLVCHQFCFARMVSHQNWYGKRLKRNLKLCKLSMRIHIKQMFYYNCNGIIIITIVSIVVFK